MELDCFLVTVSSAKSQMAITAALGAMVATTTTFAGVVATTISAAAERLLVRPHASNSWSQPRLADTEADQSAASAHVASSQQPPEEILFSLLALCSYCIPCERC